jgi:perosamine synthetase
LTTPDGRPFIPVCSPLLEGNEEKYVLEAVRGGWISSSGEFVRRFEESFAAYCGRRYGVAVSSGTAALHLALKALGAGPGDEVVIPDFTMAATLFAVLYTGARPLFVDADPDTWCLDASLLEEKITERTKVIMPVHIYGHPCDMDPLLDVARRRGAAVAEDAAEAHGALYGGRKCGSFGNLSAFSFFANKIVTTGEGGMVVTDDPDLADRCRYYRNMCFSLSGDRDFRHEDLGYNYRLTNLQAAVGLAQLERIEELVERRRENARRYLEGLGGVPGLKLPVERGDVRNVYWMYGVLVDPEVFGRDRDDLMEALGREGIDSRCFFKPLHSQGVLTAFGVEVGDTYPVTEGLAARGLYLPSGPGLTAGEIDRVCESLRGLAGGS